MLKVKTLNFKKILPIPLILIVLAFAPYFLGDYYLSLIRTVLLWAALAISWHFFSGLTRYVALGSAAFFGIGLYFTAKYLQFSINYGYYPILPLPVIVLLAGLINFALAFIIGLVTLRLKGIYFAILTFGISEVFRNIFQWWEITITGTRGTYLPIFFDPQTSYYAILVTAIAIFLLTAFLRISKFGLALRMVGECEDAAIHVGVNTSLFKTIGFAVSAMCIGLMGSAFTTRFTYINTDIAFDADYSFLPAIMTLLGGAGTAYGPLTGAIVLSLLSHYLGVAYTQYFKIILGVILLAIVIFMPNGMMGVVEKLKTTKLVGRKGLAKAPKMPP
ncbi:MAG: branched-chain amino acid ABC transporter permease [Candidatus Bathyarchaeales archaeon]